MLLFSSFSTIGGMDNRTQYSKFLIRQHQAYAQTSVADMSTNNFLTYDNSTIGIRIQYPSNFEIMELGKSVGFHTPLEAGEQVFSEQVGILTVNDDGSTTSYPSNASDAGTSIDDYLEAQLNNFINTYTDFLLVEGPSNTSINGNPAKKAVFTNTLSDGNKQRTLEIWTVDQSSGRTFQIEVSVREGKYPNFPPAHILRMIDSLEITPLQAKQQPQPLLQQESVTETNTDVVATTASTATPATTSNFLTYENSTYGVKISYPANWTYYGTAENGGFIDIVIFEAPLEGRTDSSSALFMVSRDTLPSDRSTSLKEYADSIINQYKQSIPDFNLIESSTDGSTNLLNRPAYSIVSTNVQDGIKYKTLEMGSIIGNRVYLITYDAEEAEFSKYQPIGQDMIDSFQVVGLSDNGSSAGGETVTNNTIPGSMTFGENATISSTNVDALLNEAEDLSFSGRSDEAMELFDKALAIDPNNVDALSRKGYFLGYDLGQYDEAIQLYDKALAIDPNNTSTLYDKAFTLRESGEHQEAIETFDKALAIDPNDTYLLNGKAAVLADLGRYDEALVYYDKALAIDPMDTQSLRDKGLTFESLGRYDEAIELFDKALAIDPKYIDVYNDIALALESLGKTQEAFEYYDKALAIDPNFTFPLNNKGLALANLGRYQEAIEYFDKALAIVPNSIDFLSNKGAALANLGRYQEAIEYFDKALAIDPNDTYALNNKGAALDSLGKYQEAIEYYDKALGTQSIKGTQLSNEDLQLRPNYFSVSQIIELMDSSRYEDLSKPQRVGLSTDSENTVIIVKNKGVALYNLGRYREASDNFDKILNTDSNNIAGLYYKGLCLEKLGQANEAISYRNRAAELDPTYKGEEAGITLFKPPLGQLFHIK